MTHLTTTRRRFIHIMAASSAALATGSVLAGPSVEPVNWQGIALGADAQMQLLHPDRAHAEKLVQLAVAEVHRLEALFSLHRDDSMLVRLNREGRLQNAPADMLRLLSEALYFSQLTDGHFDPSVQPLWNAYAAQLRKGQALPPPPEQLQQVLQQVGWQHIDMRDQSIALKRQGMALTLNGIAQGYITDRVTELLHAQGLEHALIDLGETRAMGQPQHRPAWLAGVADPQQRHKLLETIELNDGQALATSGGYGTPLSADGLHTHLFDPHSGAATPRWRSVSVRASNATMADALSTAFSLMDENAIRRIAQKKKATAWVLPSAGGSLMRLG